MISRVSIGGELRLFVVGDIFSHFSNEPNLSDLYRGISRYRTRGRYFYGMPEAGASQWIYTHPEEKAPRTGEGIFPLEVVEVIQVMQGRGSPLKLDTLRKLIV